MEPILINKYDNMPRQDYPRPAWVRSEWYSLNGEWEFEFDFSVSGEQRAMFLNGEFKNKITVPFCPESKLSGIGYRDFMPCVWYRKHFDIDIPQNSRVLLDIKYTTDQKYKQYAGCSIKAPLEFLDYLNKRCIPTTLRQVIIPTLNDTKENILALKKLAKEHLCVDKVELLPFRKICQVKYDKMGIPFPLAHIPEPSADTIDHLNKLICKN